MLGWCSERVLVKVGATLHVMSCYSLNISPFQLKQTTEARNNYSAKMVAPGLSQTNRNKWRNDLLDDLIF